MNDTERGTVIGRTVDFLSEAMEARRQWNILKVLKELSTQNSMFRKTSFRNEDKTDILR